MGLERKIERRFRGIDNPGKLKLATAGCPRNCSEALIKDVGALAIGDGKWEIYVGGAGGSHVRKGDILCVVDSEDERVGIERIRALVVDDSEGIAQLLDAAMQSSVEAAYDPWQEASAPKTAHQFASVMPTVDA